MRKLVIVIAMFAAYATSAQSNLPQLGKAPLKSVIATLTLEEKSRLVVGMGLNIPGLPANAPGMPPADPEAATLPEKVPGAAGRTHPIARLGIPSITVADGPAGIRIEPFRNHDSSRSYYATAWPVATLLASSWDTALVKKVGIAFGNEVKEYGADILLGPAMNIHRNPLGGRNFEYYSEDPILSGYIAAAMVKGIQSNGVGTSVKHFAANNQETHRMSVNTVVDPRTFREIYLKGFEIVVKTADPWTFMSSYNLINGVYASQSPVLLTDILRNEWGFKGLVMSDWFAGKDPIAQMKAGNDLLMPGNPDLSKKIVAAVKDGSLDEKILDRNVEKILTVILRSPEFNKVQPSGKPDLKTHAQIAREAAAESMILLKNQKHTLPIAASKKIALYGNNSYDLIAGGTGSGDVNKAYTISLAQALSNAGYKLEEDLRRDYINYVTDAKAHQPKGIMTILNPPPPPAEMDLSPDRIAAMAQNDDIAILTIGRIAGEGKDRKIENDYTLSEKEMTQYKMISEAFHMHGKKCIAVLNIGAPIDMPSWQDLADAILLAWQPGMEGGNAITDLLTGKANPSGRLATTFPIAYKMVPSANNFPGKEFKDRATKGFFGMPEIPAEVDYEEGVFVGYRFYISRNIKTAYPFGFGLSYTTFGYTELKVSAPAADGKIDISVTITNTGSIPGKEVAQLYITAPRNAEFDKPLEELKAFAKTTLLQPGASQTLHFQIAPSDCASWHPIRNIWVTDPGQYQIRIGASSEDIRLTSGQTWH